MKMKINSKDFRVREGDEVNLRKWPTNVEPMYKSKEHYQKLLGEHVAQLSSLQQLLYASNRYAVLLIFQGMDAAGKDGAITRRITAATETAATIQGGCVRATGPMRYASKFEAGIIRLVALGLGGALRK
jgi:polyphosphate kinase 2 (PPK2 family)